MSSWIKLAVALLAFLKKAAEFPLTPLPVWDDATQTATWLRGIFAACGDASPEIADILAALIDRAQARGMLSRDGCDCDNCNWEELISELQAEGVIDSALNVALIGSVVAAIVKAIFAVLQFIDAMKEKE